MQIPIFRRMCGRFDNLIARDAYRGLFKAQRLPKSNFPLRQMDACYVNKASHKEQSLSDLRP